MSRRLCARAHTLGTAVLVMLVVALQASGSTRPANAVGLSIQVSANRLVDGNGQTVVPHGVNRSGTEFRCIQNTGIFDGPSDAASVLAIKSWTNVNVVRLPLNEDCWLNVNTSGIDPAFVGQNYVNAISSYVDLLTQNGIYTILDLQWSAPGQQVANFVAGQLTLPMPDLDHSPAFWTSVANTFKTNPAVIFDLYNEPYPDNNQDTPAAWTCLKDGGTCSGVPFQAAGMQTLVNAVRATGATNVIMVSGVGWAGLMSQWLGYKPADPLGQLVASHHRYRLAWCATEACWNSTLLPIAQQVPLVTGELGEDPGDVTCTHAFVDRYVSWADSNRIPHLAWTWNTWPNYCIDLITSFDGIPSAYGQAYKSHVASFFSDDFNNGTAIGWTLAPTGYWSVVSGELKAAGPTVGGWAWQSASRSLGPGVTSFQANMATPATALSNNGIVVATANEAYQVLFVVDSGNTLQWGTSISGTWSGWTAVGSIDRSALHTYAIRRDGSGTFSVVVDGVVKASNIPAGPTSVWAGGIGTGKLFTQAELAGQVLGTRFDDVLAWQ
jgi:hypothetical protein